MTDPAHTPSDARPASKTQRKKAMLALQDLGHQLTALPTQTLRTLPLDHTLLTAILDYKRFNTHGALKRQEQYIGRLMREIDPEPIRQRLAILKGECAEHTAWLHLIERWRTRLLADDAMLASFLADFPSADIQQLRTLIRNARKEQQMLKAPHAFRQLFRQLQQIIPGPLHRTTNKDRQEPEDTST